MNETTLKVAPALAERLRAFISSEQFKTRSEVAKTRYWEEFSDQLRAKVSGDSVEVAGDAGFKVPEPSSVLLRAVRKIQRAFKQPALVGPWIRHHAAALFEGRALLSCSKAFDAIMGNAEVSIPIISPYVVNHHKLAQHPGVFSSATSVRRHYEGWSGYKASDNIILHYYYNNILRGLIGEDRPRTVLEIGAGSGNFPSILYHDWAPLRAILLDLPETLAVAVPYLSNLFPQARIVLPNEIQSGGFPKNFDFAFLTVDQLDLLANDSVDLAINCHSFQEMTHSQIDIYFKLIQRVVGAGGFFFTSNRIEKIPYGVDMFTVEQHAPPNRFAEYPWDPRNEVLVHEISRFSRLVQLDAVAMRLERIRK
jgi:putative sugar O-methyltransferase